MLAIVAGAGIGALVGASIGTVATPRETASGVDSVEKSGRSSAATSDLLLGLEPACESGAASARLSGEASAVVMGPVSARESGAATGATSDRASAAASA